MDTQTKTRLMLKTLNEGPLLSGSHQSVQKLERKSYLESTSFPAERIRALTSNGEWINIFFKDLHPDNLLSEAKALRETGLERSLREFRMYRDVLSSLHLNTPILYGSRWQPAAGTCWLFLEDAGPYPLRQIGAFSLWLKAARWAARLHAVKSAELAPRTDFLPHYDAAHFSLCATRIEKNRSVFNTEQLEQIHEALKQYYAGMETLMALPKHLIHGEFFGKNIVIRPGRDEDAVAVTDWESAAFGPRYVDLVSIISGKWSTAQRTELIHAYIQQYERETGSRIDRNSMIHELEQVSLYRALWWVGYWSERGGNAISGWMHELERIMSQPLGRL